MGVALGPHPQKKALWQRAAAVLSNAQRWKKKRVGRTAKRTKAWPARQAWQAWPPRMAFRGLPKCGANESARLWQANAWQNLDWRWSLRCATQLVGQKRSDAGRIAGSEAECAEAASDQEELQKELQDCVQDVERHGALSIRPGVRLMTARHAQNAKLKKSQTHIQITEAALPSFWQLLPELHRPNVVVDKFFYWP